MANGPHKAKFWKEFISDRCAYPAPDRLRDQLAGSTFSEFCKCGCNSFAVNVRAEIPPLVPSIGRYGAIYSCDFELSDNQTLEIILFADEVGNLAYIEVDCCANAYPVPDVIEVEDKPFNIWASEQIISDPKEAPKSSLARPS